MSAVIYKRKDFIEANVVTSAKGKPCCHCLQHISIGDTPVAVKFFSKSSLYVHFKCRDAFIQNLKD